MVSCRSSALFAVTALALGSAFVPAGAYADTPVDPAPAFGSADLVTALTKAEASTATAAAAGWVAQGTDTEKGGARIALKAIDAVDRGAAYSGTDVLLEAQHSGTYMTLTSIGAPRMVDRALMAVKRHGATWIFLPERSLDLRDAAGDSALAGLAPDLLLERAVDPTRTTVTGTPTRTVAGDGSTTYSFSQRDLQNDADSGAVTMTINADGILTALTTTTATDTSSVGFSYGPQQVALPSAASTITMQQFTEGSFLASLPRAVRSAASEVAKQVTRRAHHHAVKAGAIRAAAKRGAHVANMLVGAKDFTTRPVPGGVEITGTNRYRHKHVSYTVTAAGTKAVARRA